MHLLIWLILIISLGLTTVQGHNPPRIGCNQTLTVTHQPQNITLQINSNNSVSSLYCWWQLNSENVDKRVRIDAIMSKLTGTGQNCPEEYVAAYDGNISRNSIIKKWCGESRPKLISSNDSMFLVFKSNGSTSGQGFVITYYEETNFTCGGDLIVSNQMLFFMNSPGYPANYPNNLNCTWYISAKNPNNSISLTPEQVELQPSSDCRYDSVTLKYGSFAVDKFCDSDHAIEYVSPDSNMSVTLTTNAVFTFSGFRFHLKSVPARPKDRTYSLFADGEFNVAVSPDHFQPNMDFKWYITTVSRGFRIRIQFSISRLSNSLRCQREWISIYDGNTSKYPGLGRFCGNDRPTYTSSGEDMLVYFYPDPAGVRSGFEMFYSQVKEAEYTVELNASTWKKAITSPNFEIGNYPKNADCSWRISSDDGKSVIHLDVTDLDIPAFGDCVFDYVRAYDGYNESSKLWGKWCNNGIWPLPSYNSSGPVVFIRFHSDGYQPGKGFRIEYSHSGNPNLDTGINFAKLGEIIGGVIGGIALIAGILYFMAYCRYRNSSERVDTKGIL